MHNNFIINNMKLRNFNVINKFVFLAQDINANIIIEKDEVYIISSEETKGLYDRNRNLKI